MLNFLTFIKQNFVLTTKHWTNFLHAASICFNTFPSTLLFLSLHTSPGKMVISNYTYSLTEKYGMLTLLIGILLFNFDSLIFNRNHRLSLGFSGLFFLSVGVVHLFRLFQPSTFVLLNSSFGNSISYWAIIILLPLAILNIVAAVQIHFGAKKINKPVKFSILEALINLKKELNDEHVSPYTATILGLVTSFVFAVPVAMFALFLARSFLENFFETNTINQLIWIGAVGAQGSIVSMLLRMRVLNETKSHEANFHLFINALFRPFIGLSLAHLSFFMIKEGFIQEPYTDNSFFFAVIIAFLTGFTERVGGDMTPKDND